MLLTGDDLPPAAPRSPPSALHPPPGPVRSSPGTSGCPLAGLASTCPAGAHGLGVRGSLLHRPAPALPGFLFNNTAREAPAESARQNFLSGWGWATAVRDNPRCPGFLSALGRASTPGAETPPPLPAPPGIPGHTWLSPGGEGSKARMVE